MGRLGGRSKGCQTCRQRRVKCDEAQPECGQCLRTGRRCPGATAGNVFINVSPKTEEDTLHSASPAPNRLQIPAKTRVKASSAPASSRSRRSSRSKPSSRGSSDSDDDSAVGIRAWKGGSPPRAAHITDVTALQVSMEDIKDMELPSWYQPSKKDIFQQHFTAHFIGNFFNPASFLTKMNLWAYQLPAIIASAASPAVHCAIRAATMAFYGTKVSDLSLQTEASRWYVRGLGLQRTELEKPQSSKQLDGTALLAPLMFSMFETIMVTERLGWAQHLRAAARFLELLGPHACKDGIANSLFRSIRAGLIFMTTGWRQPPPFASDEWCTIPYSIRPKTPTDALDTILLQLPACYVLRMRWRELTKARDPEASDVRTQVEARASMLLTRLDWFWEHYGHWLQNSDYLHDGFPPEPNETPLSPRKPTTFAVPTDFRDTFGAALVAKYDTGNLLLYGVLRSIRPLGDGYEKEIFLHGQSILQAVQYHEISGPTHTGCVSMIFPMRSLVMEATLDTQRVQAQKALRHWGRKRGVAKLCNIEAEFTTSDYLRMPFGHAEQPWVPGS